jgi:hypothetical protein
MKPTGHLSDHPEKKGNTRVRGDMNNILLWWLSRASFAELRRLLPQRKAEAVIQRSIQRD